MFQCKICKQFHLYIQEEVNVLYERDIIKIIFAQCRLLCNKITDDIFLILYSYVITGNLQVQTFPLLTSCNIFEIHYNIQGFVDENCSRILIDVTTTIKTTKQQKLYKFRKSSVQFIYSTYKMINKK